jgi:hypothetical protein
MLIEFDVGPRIYVSMGPLLQDYYYLFGAVVS